MITCRERDRLRSRTLRNLGSSDWGDSPVSVQLDRARFEDRRDRICDAALHALKKSLRTDAEYILLLEDDLEFNRFLRHNLFHWPPLLEGSITLAGLYNQDLNVLAYDAKAHSLIVEPTSIFGAQAFLISRRTVSYLIKHWRELHEPLDLRLARLAAGLGEFIYYHTPSLVQHIGRKSIWGGSFCQAVDYDPLWRAPESSEVGRRWRR